MLNGQKPSNFATHLSATLRVSIVTLVGGVYFSTGLAWNKDREDGG